MVNGNGHFTAIQTGAAMPERFKGLTTHLCKLCDKFRGWCTGHFMGVNFWPHWTDG